MTTPRQPTILDKEEHYELLLKLCKVGSTFDELLFDIRREDINGSWVASVLISKPKYPTVTHRCWFTSNPGQETVNQVEFVGGLQRYIEIAIGEAINCYYTLQLSSIADVFMKHGGKYPKEPE